MEFMSRNLSFSTSVDRLVALEVGIDHIFYSTNLPPIVTSSSILVAWWETHRRTVAVDVETKQINVGQLMLAMEVTTMFRPISRTNKETTPWRATVAAATPLLCCRGVDWTLSQ